MANTATDTRESKGNESAMRKLGFIYGVLLRFLHGEITPDDALAFIRCSFEIESKKETKRGHTR